MRRRIFWVALFFAILTTPGPAARAGQAPGLPGLPQLSFDTLPVTAREAIQKAFDSAADQPRDASASGRLGMLLQAHQLFKEAEVCFRRAHTLAPSVFRWTYYLGWLQARNGECQQATETLQEARKIDPEYLPAQLKLESCLLALGRWDEAASLSESLIAKHPASAEAHFSAGQILALRNDLEGAAREFRKACEAAPDFAAAHYALAHTYRRLGKNDASLEELALYESTEKSGLTPGDSVQEEILALIATPSELLSSGTDLLRAGKLEDAAAAFEKALEGDPRLVEAHIQLISVYGQLGRFSKGEGHFLAAVRMDPGAAAAHFNHGLLLAAQGRIVEAESAFRSALQINPAFPKAQTNLGHALEVQQKVPQAMAEYRRAIETNPEDSEARFSLGRLLVNSENYQEGIQQFLRCLKSADERSAPSYLYALGAAYARAGDGRTGLDYLRQAREKAAAAGESELLPHIEEDIRSLEEEANQP